MVPTLSVVNVKMNVKHVTTATVVLPAKKEESMLLNVIVKPVHMMMVSNVLLVLKNV